MRLFSPYTLLSVLSQQTFWSEADPLRRLTKNYHQAHQEALSRQHHYQHQDLEGKKLLQSVAEEHIISNLFNSHCQVADSQHHLHSTEYLEIRNLLPPVAEERAKTTSAGKNRDGKEQWDCKIYFIKWSSKQWGTSWVVGLQDIFYQVINWSSK